MLIPHKHAEVIKAWADGQKIQFESSATNGWKNFVGSQPLFTTDLLNWRVKPPAFRYRVALFKSADGDWTDTINHESDSIDFVRRPMFDRWLTDWIEVEA